jgi:cytochrome c oxidase cbb3-type subunit 4
MDIDTLRGLMTAAAFAVFLGVLWWAYAPSRRSRFERDARLPFEGDEP